MLNRVILMGRLTADPELRKTASDLSVTSFTLAVDRNYGKGADRQTDFINCVAWRQTAEFISRYFSKGRLMAVEGSIQVRNYTDKNANKRQAVEVLVDQAKIPPTPLLLWTILVPRHLPARMGHPIPLLHLHSSSLHRLPVLDIPTVLPRNLRKSAMTKRIFPSKPLSGHLYLQL